MDLVSLLKAGEVVVLRTDTLYGLVGSALSKQAIEKIYTIKSRDADKPLLVLVASAEDAFDNQELIEKYSEQSVEPNTVIVPSPSAPEWLRHADGTVAYRVPKNKELRELLRQTGPLVAPSANPQGLPPARTIDEARAYFGEAVRHYIDGGTVPIDTPPSRLLSVQPDGSMKRLR